MKSFLDLVNDCDDFPYTELDTDAHGKASASFFTFYLVGKDGTTPTGPHGFIPEWVIDKMPWDENWKIDTQRRQVTLSPASAALSQTQIIQDTLRRAKEQKVFKVLDGWRGEEYGVLGRLGRPEEDVGMERSGSPLFGINTYGVHMTLYTQQGLNMKIWVPRRSKNKQTYGGMLDNSVAGGLAIGENPFDCLIREAWEEASLPEELVRTRATACGTVSYVHLRDARAGGESGMFQPECQFCYDMEVGDTKPEPNDTEVEAFYLWSVEEVKQHLASGDFKPNCALVLLDFFVRHGIMSAENEPNYVEIVSRLHRRLPFPSNKS